MSPEGERISKPFSPEAGNIISLLIYSRVEPKNMSYRSFHDKLAKWLHRNSLLSKVASPQEKPLTNDEKKELRPFLCPKLQKKLDSNSLEDAQLKYLLYTPGGKEKLNLLLSSPEKEGKQLHPGLPSEAEKGLLLSSLMNKKLVVTLLQILKIVVIQDRLHKNRLVILEVMKMD